ncbi:hypothetical protein ERO13_D06G109000v2 [Gossypium hirsutum]|uniref:Protein FAM32A-like n=4 Tax=Gossypium TaxID=3633 RepID=A0A1U8J010_GOSHI|nr:protein FAM32A-like [Gossypium hirsutum]XP_016683702.2 protein FAM32A-like [Gossypium hirsutum]TYH66629.1 hypothetical protein ES332_D06G137200v1 [Gossypium tomentosum]TYI77171.1 hypothetical protein E1A91_D06G127600v1 [Gossypium mustelinum]KAG4142024.1 hypothetical protein ERO13_D06G109000v2 [Gossypium hirsutum]KAG4142025.1 hypothetical protein ERO13_D06G109000v2 [Gossypium hirsutum]TYH66630.1 hypothetical protein ES332_D06G137200v1 [Gossypium tomentosum]
MSSYQNVAGGRLRLKGKPLHVFKAKAEEADPISKKKRKKHKHRYAPHSQGENRRLSTDTTDDNHEAAKDGDEATAFEDHLTPAERKFLEQTRQLELQRLAKMATKSHHDRIQEFNQYLANLTEHYDIPKVGPG